MIGTTRGKIHDMIMQLLKECSLQWFREKIRYHIGRRAMFDSNTIRVDLILDEKISDVHVSGPLRTGTAAILLNKD
jgi:hypothetical protein